jgi:hypothetical protein
MKTKEEIQKEIQNLETDLKTMKKLPCITEENRENALFCQQQIINALKWTLE